MEINIHIEEKDLLNTQTQYLNLIISGLEMLFNESIDNKPNIQEYISDAIKDLSFCVCLLNKQKQKIQE